MSYQVRIARQAAEYLRRLDRTTQARITRRLDQIAADPFGPQTKQLKGAGGRRTARVGDWRIVFRVEPAERVVEVSAIGPRGGVYRGL